MARVYIRKSKRSPDYYEVMNGTQSKGKHLSKTAAKEQAEAIRRVKTKRAKKSK